MIYFLHEQLIDIDCIYARSLTQTVSKDIPADYDRSKYISIFPKFFFAIEFFVIIHMQIEISFQMRCTVNIHTNEEHSFE